jgi:sugar O-acyltransferase (sialic acid O-acetyltransferase NeuD family)
MARLAILGASGHGKVVADAALSSKYWTDIAFFDDAFPESNKIEIWDILGNTQDLLAQLDMFDGVVVAIGNNVIRLSKQEILKCGGCRIVSIIHSSAVVSPFANIDAGTVVMAGAIVNAFSRIGKSCIINSNAVVEHDCKLSDGVHISPGAALAGAVSVGLCSWIGIGVSVKQLVSVGEDIIIGAGAVVTKDINTKGSYVGSPARKLIKQFI